MCGKFAVFDVETPNSFNNRMSAIGVTVIENGIVAEKFYSLVNPETDFDCFNINLTGISPEDVYFEPSFDEIWCKLEPLFDGAVLVAHNAVFDLGVLSKCLESYHIEWLESVEYLCTCRTGRKIYPDFCNHRLDTMCEKLNIPLNHHNAGSDSDACAALLLDYLQKTVNAEKFIKKYDLINRRTI